MGSAIVVIDLPESTSPEVAARLLNAPGESYFLVQVLPVSGGHRAYLRRYKQTLPTKAETAKAAGAAVDDVTALSVVRANSGKPVRVIVDALAAAGIKRGRQWVSDQLTAICAEDGREDQALAILKDCPEEWPPSEVVECLRYRARIKRTVAWVRQKREEQRAVVRADKS